ncbi:caspase family protein [Sphaerisporangium sp. NPDC004334]
MDLFTKRLGYQHLTNVGLDPTKDQLTQQLRAVCRSADRRPDDLLAVYIAGHGEILEDGEHVLLTSDTDPDDIDDALPTVILAHKMLRGTRIRRLLLLLDTCYSGRGGNEIAASALAQLNQQWGGEPWPGFVVISSAQPHEQAQTGAFPHLLEQAISSLVTAGHGPHALPLDSLVHQMNSHPDRPGHQRIGLAQIGLMGQVPPFLPNPRHDGRLTEVDLAVQQAVLWKEQADRREVEFRTRLLVRAMASGDPDRLEWWFSGRRQALADITAWLRNTSIPVLAVTAGPGSGKTAVLGLIATLTQPERRRTVPIRSIGLDPTLLPSVGEVDVAIYAQNLTNEQVLQAICAAGRIHADTVGELLAALATRVQQQGGPVTVLVDAVDEAATPDSLCARILRPLIEHASGRLRLLLGTRPHLLDALGMRRSDQIDLDADRYADPEALRAYTIRNLIDADPNSPYQTCSRQLLVEIAEQVAAAADQSFLVARITASTLAATSRLPNPGDSAWRAGLPRQAGEAMQADLRLRLGHDAIRAADLLRPLAFAEGQGLPWEDVWAPLAGALSGQNYTDEDLLWLRRTAGAYVVEAIEADRSAYRLYHQALVDHLRQQTPPAEAHAAFVRTLLHRIPYALDGSRDWSRAHPYTRHYLAAHAAHSGLLGDLIGDLEYLVHADPDALVARLGTVESDAELPVAIYRTSIGIHRHGDTDMRRQTLALDAARYNATSILAALNSKAVKHAWKPLHATGGRLSPAILNTLDCHDAVNAVACTVLDGRAVAVTGSDDATVRVWDLATGRPVGEPLSGHIRAVNAVACTVLDGRAVAVTGSDDATVRVWDLATGRPVGEPLSGHIRAVNAVACTVLDGRPVTITGSGSWFEDNTVRIWDLTTGRPVGQALLGHNATVNTVAYATLDGRPIVISGSDDATVRIWRLATGRPVGRPIVGHIGDVQAVACTTLHGGPVAVTGSSSFEDDGNTLRMWDLTTGRPVGRPFMGDVGAVHAVACTVLNGRPVVVAGCSSFELDDDVVRVWDLATGLPIGQPLTGHNGLINAVACIMLNGRPVAVTGSGDATVRVWDLTTGRLVGQPLIGHTSTVYAVACTVLDGRPVAITGSGLPGSEEDDDTVRVWDLTTGRLVGQPLIGHTSTVYAVACTVLDGRSVAVSGSEDATTRVWDLATGRLVGQLPTGHTGAVHTVACAILDGFPVVVTGSADSTVRITELVHLRCRGVIYLPAEAYAVAVTESGLVVSSFGRDLATFGQNL